jgi:hypothetical protein
MPRWSGKAAERRHTRRYVTSSSPFKVGINILLRCTARKTLLLYKDSRTVSKEKIKGAFIDMRV